MKKYNFFRTDIWSDDSFLRMSPEQKLIMMYLLTCPYNNWCGIFKLSMATMGHFIGLKPNNIESAFFGFISHFSDLVQFDQATGEVAILNWAQISLLDAKPNTLKTAENEAKEVESEALITAMIEHTKSASLKSIYLNSLRSIRMQKMNNEHQLNTVLNGANTEVYCLPLIAPNDLNNNDMCRIRNRIEIEDIAHSEKCAADSPLDAKKETNGFDEFWNTYQNKVDKGKALKAFKHLNAKEKKDAIAGIEKYNTYLKATRITKKYPATYLNAKSWENEYAISNESESELVDIPLTETEITDYENCKAWVNNHFANLSRMRFFTHSEFKKINERSPEVFGERWKFFTTERTLKEHIKSAFERLNLDSYQQRAYPSIYAFLQVDLKKRIYAD